MGLHKIGHMLKLDDEFIGRKLHPFLLFFLSLGICLKLSIIKSLKKKINEVSKNCSGLANSEKEIAQ